MSGKSDQENRRNAGDFFVSASKILLVNEPLPFWVYFIFVHGSHHVKLSHDHQYESYRSDHC
jgi:hypothetical protein